MQEFKLPKDFLLGSATAATQIDGGDVNNNWYYWRLDGKIENEDSPIIADNHYVLYKEDIELMKTLEHEIYRLSVDWSRIEPEKGVWNEEGLEHYRDELNYLLMHNIKPLVTLHHFSCPQWFQEDIGWDNPDSVYYFTRYVKKIVNYIGDLVSEYCTINEPNVLANESYVDGTFPLGIKNNTKLFFKSSKHMIISHLKSYKIIHDIRKKKGYKDTKFKGDICTYYLYHMGYVIYTSKYTLLIFICIIDK